MKNNIFNSIVMCSLSLIACNNEATAQDHKIGDTFGGGIIFQLTKGPDGVEHGLIITADMIGRAPWSSNTSQEIGAKNASDGVANTAAILKAGGAKTEAAGLCDNFEKDGFSDWYLPSVDEMQMVYNNLKPE